MRWILAGCMVLTAVGCDEQTRVVGTTPTPPAITAPTSSPPSPGASATSSPTPTRTAVPSSPAPPSQTPRPSATASAPNPTATPAPATPPAAGGPATLGSCTDEATTRPATAGPAVPVVFTNQSGATLDYLSLDAQGRRVLARSLASGSYTQQAHVGDVWIASRGGTCVALYRVTAAALLISSAQRQSLVPLYVIAGIVSDASTGAALSGQTVFVWQPEDSACAVIGGTESPGYIVSSITGPDGKYAVYVTPGDYKIRLRATAGYVSQWWGETATTRGQCTGALVVTIDGDAFNVSFALRRQ